MKNVLNRYLSHCIFIIDRLGHRNVLSVLNVSYIYSSKFVFVL